MPTPVENVVANVNDSSVNQLFQAVANNATARESLSQSDRNIDAVSTSIPASSGLGVNGEAVRLCLTRREGQNPANFADLDAVAADQELMQSIAARQESSLIAARSQKAAAAIATSQTAMQEVAASQTAMQEVAASQTAMQEVAASQTALDLVTASATARGEIIPSATAMGEMAASATAMSDISGDQTFMQQLAKSQTAMQEVAASQTAMTEIDQVDFAVRAIMCGTTTLDPTSFANADAISQDAGAMSEIAGDATTMNTLAASQTAMQEVTASQTAMQEVANSQTAVNQLLIDADGVETNVADTILSSSSAVTELSNSVVAKTLTRDTNNNNNNKGGGDFPIQRALLVDIPEERANRDSRTNLVNPGSAAVGNIIIKDDHPAQIVDSVTTNNAATQRVDILVLEKS